MTWSELASHDGVAYPPDWRVGRGASLMFVLEAINAEMPIRLVSGYRTPAHNAAVGGAKGSKHMTGLAADIKPARTGDTVDQLLAVVRRLERGNKIQLGGLGIYPRHLHVDIANRGTRVEWTGKGE